MQTNCYLHLQVYLYIESVIPSVRRRRLKSERRIGFCYVPEVCVEVEIMCFNHSTTYMKHEGSHNSVGVVQLAKHNNCVRKTLEIV